VKVALTDRLSAALLFEQPFGADVAYPGDPARSELGGTFAEARTDSVTALLRYRTDARLSLHGGLRLQQASGEIGLSGLAYGPFSGYRVELDPDWAAGYVLGVAYEIPEIAFRMALTYNSAITHAFETVETGNANPALDGASTTEVDTPRSVNLDIQSGIAEDTLLFGGLRWAEWSAFRIDPEGFSSPVAVGGSGEGLVDLEDTTTWEIGLARRFGPRFGASVAILHEAPGDTLVSPLAPSTGASAIQFGGAWTEGDVTLTGGLRYTWLGDAEAETGTPDTARASFEDNSSLSVGLGLGFAF
jgi:long-subunit fatty acid transport protein